MTHQEGPRCHPAPPGGPEACLARKRRRGDPVGRRGPELLPDVERPPLERQRAKEVGVSVLLLHLGVEVGADGVDGVDRQVLGRQERGEDGGGGAVAQGRGGRVAVRPEGGGARRLKKEVLR